MIKAIATSFENLQQLSIHVGVGIADSINKAKDGFPLQKAFESVLTEETAKSFGKQFFECSKQSSLKKITLKSGENLRWFPQWHPGYANAEEESARTFEIFPPSEQGHEPRLMQIENDYYPHLNWWRRQGRVRKAHPWTMDGANDEGSGALGYRRRSAPRILLPSDFTA